DSPRCWHLVLPAMFIQALGKIPLAVQERYRHHGDVEIGRGAHRIARQDTQPATVRGHTHLERDLHGEIRNGSVGLHTCDSLRSRAPAWPGCPPLAPHHASRWTDCAPN